jgi:hypothetical protein
MRSLHRIALPGTQKREEKKTKKKQKKTKEQSPHTPFWPGEKRSRPLLLRHPRGLKETNS